ncbi:MAG: nuclear transport factor 2 family protein [Planctomycetes bacterium]|nr:nuclear transport factor 2 family protein [Planctomycetota bacterium]
MTPEEVVQKQLEAYSACDIDAFAATYTEDVKVIDGTGKVLCEGLAQLCEVYGPLFRNNPNQMAIITKRITAGDWVIDDEEVIGRADNKRRNAVAIYRVRDGLICHVTLVAK